MTSVTSHRDLRVWRESMALARECYRATRTFPDNERYGLTVQIRRAATSVPANIAEGRSRESRRQYTHFLYIARGSLAELETHWLLAQDLDLASPSLTEPIVAQCNTVGRMLNGLIRSLRSPRSTEPGDDFDPPET